jgi:putative peptidoglycan lipid II flippase
MVSRAGDSEAARPRGLARSTAIFSFWTGISRIAGLAREILAAALYGTQGSISAFVIAFQVPNLLRSLVADSAISAAFVPVYTELQEKGRHKDAQRLAGAMLGITTIGLGALTLLAIVLAPWFMPFFAPGLSDDLIEETIRLARLMFPIVVLLGITGIVFAILQAADDFGPTAFAPVLWNAIIILCLAIAGPLFPDGSARITVYAVGILAGTVGQLAYVAWHLRGMGPFPLSLRISASVKRVLLMMLPVTIGLGLINVNLSVDAAFATLVSEQAPRAIDAAFRLYLLPQGVFSVAVATVLFPTISRLVARQDIAGVRSSVADGVRMIFFILLPAAAFLLLLAEPIVRLVFQYGEFDSESTALTSESLLFFALGLVFNGASLLLVRSFFSLQEPWIPTIVAGGGVLLNALLDFLLYEPLGIGGIPLATSLVSFATFLVLALLLARRLGGLHGGRVLDGIVRSTVVAALTGVMAWSTWYLIDSALGQGFVAQVIALGGAAVAALATFVAAGRGLEMPEMSRLTGLVGSLR